MKTMKGYSYPAEAEIIVGDGAVEYFASYRQATTTGKTNSVIEAAKEIYNFLVFWGEYEEGSKGVAWDIAEEFAELIASETNQDPKEVFFSIVS